MAQKYNLDNPDIQKNIMDALLNKDKDVKILQYNRIKHGQRNRILLTLQCSCGNVFQRLWDDARSKKYGTKCPSCCYANRGKNHRKDKNEVIALFESKGYKILDKHADFTRNTYIEVENKDGYRGFISYNRLLRNRNIAIFEVRTNKKNYIYNINLWSKLNGIGTEVIDFSDDKPYTTQGIKCRCSCGTEFITSIISFQSGKQRCDRCARSMSRYELIVEKFLKEHNIQYISQYRINSCKDILPLSFDFYIDGKLIEVDGHGHYQPCHFNQISYEDAYKSFIITKKHDKIKNEYCKKFNICLLRIPYWEIDNGEYKNKIIQFIEE